jgi:SpoVK/Ycf46/Vps4 family AAA+-type ATPase
MGALIAAQTLGSALEMSLYRVDLGSVVSKYIGETEKNLDRMFKAAKKSDAILFFDEADALFGKRTDVKDSHDRYANIEVNYLLQRLEENAGVTILATARRANIDDAFLRRLRFVISIPPRRKAMKL